MTFYRNLDSWIVRKEKPPFNAGDAYEKRISDILLTKGMTDPRVERAGADHGPDHYFIHIGNRYGLEIKMNPEADYGQKKLVYMGGAWEWAVDDEITQFYTRIGVLKKIRDRNIIPRKYSKPDKDLTAADKEYDMKTFECKLPVRLNAMFRYYEEKGVYYIQIGEGWGFYHLMEDKANIGSPQLKADIVLRLRAKTVRSHPLSNYEFIAVLKVESISLRSWYDLLPDQFFPPISPWESGRLRGWGENEQNIGKNVVQKRPRPKRGRVSRKP